MMALRKIMGPLLALLLAGALPGADAAAVLKAMEENRSGSLAPRDLESDMVMTIRQGQGVRVRELHAWTRNLQGRDDWRLLKFLEPADVRGVGLLVLDEDSMYIYLPEFHRTRRIASSGKKDPFMGSDFSYEDMGTSILSRHYDPRLLKESDSEWQLELLRKPGSGKPYPRILLTVDRARSMPRRMELYDGSGTLVKVAEEEQQRVGPYWVMSRILMTNLKKGTSTLLEMKNVKADQGLKDEVFSERFLKKKGS